MLKQKTGLFVIFLYFVATVQPDAKGNKNNEEWELARKTGDISIYYRWILNDTIKTREMRAKFVIDANIAQILSQFSEPENYYSWAVGIKECMIKKFDENNWITYTLMNYPWPFKKKDLVTRHLVSNSGNETIVSIYAEPGFYAKKEGIERMQNYFGEWKFSTKENGSTAVDYCVVSFTKPVFPRFIQDPVIQKLFIDSFQDLKQLAETK